MPKKSKDKQQKKEIKLQGPSVGTQKSIDKMNQAFDAAIMRQIQMEVEGALLYGYRPLESHSEDSPEALYKKATDRIGSGWVGAIQDEKKSFVNSGQVTRAEQMAQLEERYYGIKNPYSERVYMYKFTDGEVEVVEGSNPLMLAAAQFEKNFNL